jgi:hypothetical protein
MELGTCYRPADQGSVSNRGRDTCIRHRVHVVYEAHPTSYSVSTMGLKRPECEADYAHSSNVSLRLSLTLCPLSHTFHNVELEHRDTFAHLPLNFSVKLALKGTD